MRREAIEEAFRDCGEFVRRKEVLEVLGIDSKLLSQTIHRKKFPKPIKTMPNVFLKSEIIAALAEE